MPQGKLKLGNAKKSGGGQKRKAVKVAKKKGKGGSGAIAVERNKGVIAATKAINRKNERMIAAKAMTVSGDNAFRLSDLAGKGKKENERQTAHRDKRERQANTMSDRIHKQLSKLCQQPNKK